VDLSDLDLIVLSHGHYDHTGGLKRVLEEGDELKSDELMDDQALVLKTVKGLFVVLGCAHRGMINTKAYKIQRLGVSHCTGPQASARLADEFGDRFFYNNTGSVIELEDE
jgi:7,8-dihydropterin-6-yl-methyl-4-(beta-D-ribofuranosyl)aminobenzene 5'-phosphate synthase